MSPAGKQLVATEDVDYLCGSRLACQHSVVNAGQSFRQRLDKCLPAPGVPGATGYRLYRREGDDGDWALLKEVARPGFGDQTVEPGMVYAYRVEAFNADADGRPSEVRKIKMTGTRVLEQHAPPTRLTVETARVRRGDQDLPVVRLQWEAPRGWDCRGYVIFRGLTGSSHFAAIGVSRSTSFVDEKTSPDYSLSYFVRGIDSTLRQPESSNEAVAATTFPRR